MFRKITAFFFILLANVSLLAHAVIPHHHHHLVVCLGPFQSGHEEGDHCLQALDHHPAHDEPGSTECILNQAMVIPTARQEISPSCASHSEDLFSIWPLPSTTRVIGLFPSGNGNRTRAAFFRIPVSFPTYPPALRAPPVW